MGLQRGEFRLPVNGLQASVHSPLERLQASWERLNWLPVLDVPGWDESTGKVRCRTNSSHTMNWSDGASSVPGVSPAFSPLHQIVPSTSQSVLDPPGRGEEDVDLAGLDSLDVANVQVHLFGQFLLGNGPGVAFTADILAELLDIFLHRERHNGAILAIFGA